MMDDNSHQITQLLIQWSEGNDFALDELIPLVYDELRTMAKRHMSGQKKGHTFQTTELIHEAYLKISGGKEQNWKNRTHFFGAAAMAMRHILVNYAISKQSRKRGGEWQKVTLEETAVASTTRSDEIIALNEALKELANLDERTSRVVELKFFGGLTNEEAAEVLKVSRETVKRDWQFARSWLLRELAN